MAKLSLKVFLLALPVLAMLFYIECRLAKMNSNYRVKRELLEKVAPDVEVIVAGSSNAYYGINPTFFDHRGFNIAYRLQSPYYDNAIIFRYLDRMPKLKLVIVPFVYLTFGVDSENLIEGLRIFFYDHFWGISQPVKKNLREMFAYYTDPRRYSMIALFADRTYDFVLHNFQDILDDTSEGNGWYNGGIEPMDPNSRIGPDGAANHNGRVSVEKYQENLAYIDELYKTLKQKNIQLAFIQTPIHRLYRDYIDKEKYAKMNEIINDYATRNHIPNFNYVEDERFTGVEFTVMPDHLNAVGAEKISRIINEDVIKPIFKE